jgi:hypothetical protein
VPEDRFDSADIQIEDDFTKPDTKSFERGAVDFVSTTKPVASPRSRSFSKKKDGPA